MSLTSTSVRNPANALQIVSSGRSPKAAATENDRATSANPQMQSGTPVNVEDKPRFRLRGTTIVPVNASAKIRQEMVDYVRRVAQTFEIHYGPRDYKGEIFGFSLAQSLANAEARIAALPSAKLSDFHSIVRDFMRSTRDYHVGVSFAQTASASLPLRIAPAENGTYVIAYIDRAKLGKEVFPFDEGDEIVRFGGQPVAEAVAELQARFPTNKPLTDHARACATLTSRNGSVADVIPSDTSIEISVRSARTGKESTRQVSWTKSDERYATGSLPSKAPDADLERALLRDDSMRAADFHDVADAADPYARGARVSYLPSLGPVVMPADPKNPFHAFIYRHPSGKLVGVIRIETYSPKNPSANAAAFAKLIKHFEEATDALIIDQVNNGGGSVAYSRAILSCLSPTAMATPKRTMTIATDDVVQADEIIEKLKNVRDDAGARKALGKEVHGYPVTFDYVKRQLAFSRFIKSEYEAGKRLSAPFHMGGIDAVNPSPVATYTKPIMILVNESAYSSADAVPAVLQDNKRAVVFGTETAGAGGSVRSFNLSNRLGVVSFSLTANISYRPGGEPIENRGVKPDVVYALTGEDYRTKCKPYGERVNAEIAKILGN